MAGSVKQGNTGGQSGSRPGGAAHQHGDPIVNLRHRHVRNLEGQGHRRAQGKDRVAQVVIFNENLGRVDRAVSQEGSKVYIEGQLQTRKWTDQQGIEKYSTEIVLQRFRGDLTILDGRSGGGASSEYGEEEGGGQISRGGDFGRSSPMKRRPPASIFGRRRLVDRATTTWTTTSRSSPELLPNLQSL